MAKIPPEFNSNSLPKLLTYKQVQQLCNLSRITIWRLVSAGRFPAALVINPRTVRFRLGEVLAWADGTWQPQQEVQK